MFISEGETPAEAAISVLYPYRCSSIWDCRFSAA
uniref:Uncharacterized protein n=1 Tax=Arundo donax TaxID=35708 RepID=A0A0A8ZAX4_ARUDO